MAPKEAVFVIIPVHNRKSITLSCLASLAQNGDLERCVVVIVDDGSTDGTEQAIDDSYPEVTVLHGDGSLWWTGAIARGMKYAIEQGAEYIIWLNDDCIPYPNTLSLLVEFCRSHPDAIAGAAGYLADLNYLHETGAQGRKRVAAKPGEVVPVDEMSGHCVCIPGAVINRIGFPDMRRFPHYHGDSMYILKATRSGFPAYIVGDARIDHKGIIKSNVQDFLSESKVGRSPITEFNTLFLSKKSFYYLPTQFFYYLEKYGAGKGIPIFLTKLIGWFIQFLQLQFGKPEPIGRSEIK
ncbi:glycosyltransferase family 2 protein [Leptothermofonsia sp. ETS-13]|uniref:glycosyltransferase family 2 protein n=1 Tax=Leptothermofonsia sp. ETS-13 TaxID=3035696 RepID=UPI003BA2089E